MKKIIVTIAIIINAVASFAQEEGKLAYKKVTQSYKGDTVYVKLNTDTTNYWTDKKAFDFNKDIFVKGVKLGGGGSEVAKYLKNFSPNDTVISFVAKSGTTGMQIQSTAANQCIRLNNSFTYGTGILSYVTGLEGVAGRFDATGPTANTAYGVRINSKIATSLRIDSLNNEKFSINAGGIPKITRYSGSGIRPLSVNNNGEIIPGSSGSTIATQLKNYNTNQDTIISFPELTAGKIGINNANISNSFWKVGNMLFSGRLITVTSMTSATNLLYIVGMTGAANGIQINTIGSGCSGLLAQTNNGYLTYTQTNTGTVDRVRTNNGYYLYIEKNNGQGISVNETNKTAIGVKSYAADSVSLASPARTGIFGKSGYYTDIDGFGQLRLYQNNVLKLKIDTAGDLINYPPHINSLDTVTNYTKTLTVGAWWKVSNSTNNLFMSNLEATKFTMSADTIIVQKKGHYAATWEVNITGNSNATYEYRIRVKESNGSIKSIKKFEIISAGTKVQRQATGYINCNTGVCKYWLEMRKTSAGGSNDVTISGASLNVFTVHLLP